MTTTPVDYYVSVEGAIKDYIEENSEKFTTNTEIIIEDIFNKYNSTLPKRIIARPETPLKGKFIKFGSIPQIEPMRYFIDFIKNQQPPNVYKVIGLYIANNQSVVTYSDDTEIDEIKNKFNNYINEKLKPFDELIDQPDKIITDPSILSSYIKTVVDSHVNERMKYLTLYALGFSQNNNKIELTNSTFDNYLKNYEFHNRSDLKNLLIYTVLDDNDKLIDIKNLIKTMKANVGEEVYQKIFIEILEEVDQADKENKAKKVEVDITNVIETVVLRRYPADQSVVDAIQNNIDTYKIIEKIKAESLATGEISQAKLIEIFATASGVDERQKANGRYFIAFLRNRGYTVKRDGDIEFFKGPPTGNPVTDVPKEFTNYRERYEFHSKEEIAPLVYLAITDIDGEIFPDIQARIQKIEKELSDPAAPAGGAGDAIDRAVAGAEKRSRIGKFVDVLKEFKRYVDKNGVTFTNQNMANTLPMIEDFVNNLYPNYGPQQAIDNITFYSAPSDFKKDEALESVVTSIAPMRGPYALEVDKDRYAYEKLRAEARKIDANHELKRRNLKDVAQDLARLAILVPDDASQKYVMETYANSALHQGMLKIVEKLTPEQKEQKKGKQNSEKPSEFNVRV